MKKLSIIMVALAALVSGCTADKPMAITQQMRTQIDSADMAVMVEQDEVKAISEDAMGATAGNGIAGLAVGIIGTAIMHDIAYKKATPVREALAGYDFRAAIQREIELALTLKPTLPVNMPIRMLSEDSKELRNKLVSQSKASAILLVDVAYGHEDHKDRDKLIAKVNVEMYPRSPALYAQLKSANPKNPLANGNIMLSRTFHEPYFTGINAANARQAMDKVAKEIANDIVNSLSLNLKPAAK